MVSPRSALPAVPPPKSANTNVFAIDRLGTAVIVVDALALGAVIVVAPFLPVALAVLVTPLVMPTPFFQSVTEIV